MMDEEKIMKIKQQNMKKTVPRNITKPHSEFERRHSTIKISQNRTITIFKTDCIKHQFAKMQVITQAAAVAQSTIDKIDG